MLIECPVTNSKEALAQMNIFQWSTSVESSIINDSDSGWDRYVCQLFATGKWFLSNCTKAFAQMNMVTDSNARCQLNLHQLSPTYTQSIRDRCDQWAKMQSSVAVMELNLIIVRHLASCCIQMMSTRFQLYGRLIVTGAILRGGFRSEKDPFNKLTYESIPCVQTPSNVPGKRNRVSIVMRCSIPLVTKSDERLTSLSHSSSIMTSI